MNKTEFVAAVAEKLGKTKKDTGVLVDTVIDELKKGIVDNGEVQLFQFGKFEVKTRAAHKGINPATKETIQLPETNYVHFKPAKAFKEAVN